MTEERKKELKKLSYSMQLLSSEYIFSGEYNNEEIDFLLKERQRLDDINS